eukprot:c2012_g1_i1.p1 GENE.c2012_g1_i1~~c2012_g1_i1.p1  ORF type:complete len:166 (-),score=35.65 c2012_g1_i1:381-878(-)
MGSHSTTEQSRMSEVVAGGAEKPAEAAEQIAQGLYELLKPVVLECDARVQAVFASQSALSSQMDTLSRELDTLLSSSEMPVLTPYARKLAESRRRIASVNTTLLLIQDRLDRMYSNVPDELKAKRGAAIDEALAASIGMTTPAVAAAAETPAVEPAAAPAEAVTA